VFPTANAGIYCQTGSEEGIHGQSARGSCIAGVSRCSERKCGSVVVGGNNFISRDGMTSGMVRRSHKLVVGHEIGVGVIKGCLDWPQRDFGCSAQGGMDTRKVRRWLIGKVMRPNDQILRSGWAGGSWVGGPETGILVQGGLDTG